MAAVVALVGCSEGDDDGAITVAAVAEATRSADSARIRIDLTYPGREKPTRTEGVINFRTGESRLETRFGGTSDESSAITITVGDEWFVGPADHDENGPSWVRFPEPEGDRGEPFAGLVVDPAALVDELKRAATDLERAGSGDVRGERTHTYRIKLRSGSRVLPLMMIPPNESSGGTMDVDNQGRLRRLVIEPDGPGLPKKDDHDAAFPVPTSSELELWGFGVDVEVEQPHTDDIVDFDDPKAGELMSRIFDGLDIPSNDASEVPDPVDPELSGPFVKVAGGTWENVTWEVWEAPTTDGRVCRTFELDPPPAPDRFGDFAIPGLIQRDGHQASCGPKADLFRSGDPVQQLGSWYADSDYWYFAGTVAPEISALDVELKNGSTIRVEVDPVSKVFTLFSRDGLRIEEVRPDAGGKASITCVVENDQDFAAGFLNCSGTVHRSPQRPQ